MWLNAAMCLGRHGGSSPFARKFCGFRKSREVAGVWPFNLHANWASADLQRRDERLDND